MNQHEMIWLDTESKKLFANQQYNECVDILIELLCIKLEAKVELPSILQTRMLIADCWVKSNKIDKATSLVNSIFKTMKQISKTIFEGTNNERILSINDLLCAFYHTTNNHEKMKQCIKLKLYINPNDETVRLKYAKLLFKKIKKSIGTISINL